MAKFQCDFLSRALLRNVTFNVILPVDKLPVPGQPQTDHRPFKTLYLLHGFFGNCNDWLHGTNIERWAQERNICVVMPSGDNHFYVDNPKSNQMYGYFISKELVEITRKAFPLSEHREDTWIGGLSMGGYGAIINALQHPEVFGAVCALSSALLVDQIPSISEYTHIPMTNRGYFESVFGELDQLIGSDKDYNSLAKKIAQSEEKPRFYIACGTEDSLLLPNQNFFRHIQSLGFDVTYEEGPGNHEWDFWNKYILRALDWLTTNNADIPAHS